MFWVEYQRPPAPMTYPGIRPASRYFNIQHDGTPSIRNFVLIWYCNRFISYLTRFSTLISNSVPYFNDSIWPYRENIIFSAQNDSLIGSKIKKSMKIIFQTCDVVAKKNIQQLIIRSYFFKTKIYWLQALNSMIWLIQTLKSISDHRLTCRFFSSSRSRYVGWQKNNDFIW
jgi:hypothetical protein